MLSGNDMENVKDRNGDRIGPAPWMHTAPPGPVTAKALRREPHLAAICGHWPCPLIVRRAQGTVVEDIDQNRYLDFDAGARVSVAGHAHPRVLRALSDWSSAALSGEADIPPAMVQVNLIRQLLRISRGDQSRQVCLTSGAAASLSLAVEAARRHTGRRRVVELVPPGAGAAAGTSPTEASPAGLNVLRATCPEGAEASTLRELVGSPHPAAAVVLRPLSSAANHWTPRDGFLEALHSACCEHGSLLILDESESGLGRTGRMFWCDRSDVVPDALIVSDGAAGLGRFSAVIASGPFAGAVVALSGGEGRISGPIAVAAAATLELVERQFVRRAAESGPAAFSKLSRIADKHRNLLRPRGLGLVLAVDVIRPGKRGTPAPALRDRVLGESFSRGLLLRGCGRSGIRFVPPLTVNRLQLEIALEIFDEAVATVAE